MIFVSGTKRSGTSMWMQILRAAGFPVLGKAFPRNWGTNLRDANPDGFYESLLRDGIYFATNPHPVTGKYFLPEHVEGYVVKVFIPGVVRSERAYISQVIANVRAWREYEGSIARLYALEAGNRPAPDPDAGDEEPIAPFHFPPALEWWMENFALVRDISLRKYPARLYAYDQVVEHPEAIIPKVLAWIGSGDVEAAIAAVKPENRTQVDPGHSDSVEPELAKVFDDLYAALREGKGISGALLATLNQTNVALLPRLRELQLQVVASQRRVAAANRAKAEAQGKRVAGPLGLDGLPDVEF